MAGQIYEQIGLYDKSICAYLKAYLYGETENRCERVKKISQLCGTLLHEADRDVVPGKLRKVTYRACMEKLSTCKPGLILL